MSEWLLQRGKGKTIGPFTTAEIVEGLRVGEIPEGTLVADLGGKEWLPLARVAPFAEAIRARAGAAAPPARTEPAEPAEAEQAAPLEGAPPRASSAPGHGAARRPLRVAFGAATKAGRRRVRLASLGLALAAAATLTLGLSPLGRDLFDLRRSLRDASTYAASAALVAALGALIGERRDRRGAHDGSALARGATLAALATALGCAALAAREAAPLVERARRAVGLSAAVAIAVAAVALSLVWPAFRVPSRGRGGAVARSALVALAATGLLGAALVQLRRARDVLYVRDPLDAPAFADARSMEAWLDAEQAGAARLALVAPLLERAVPLPCDARVRFVAEGGSDAGAVRQVELLDGPSRGARLFVPRRATSPAPRGCR